jgi:hypothetical protein
MMMTMMMMMIYFTFKCLLSQQTVPMASDRNNDVILFFVVIEITHKFYYVSIHNFLLKNDDEITKLYSYIFFFNARALKSIENTNVSHI